MFSESLSKIRNRFILWSLSQRAKRLRQLNPEKFYVENVRVLMNTSTQAARDLCEMGVEKGVFDRHVEAIDPLTNRTVAVAPSEDELAPEVLIEPGIHNQDDEAQMVPVSSLKQRTYYSRHQK